MTTDHCHPRKPLDSADQCRAMSDLDDVDRRILHLLQRDARKYTTTEIGEEIGVSSSTVSNRMQKLEEAGVIEGYQPIINYGKAGYPFFALIVCTAPPGEREALADDALDIYGVVNVRLFISGKYNFRVAVVGETPADIADAEKELHALGLTIEETPMLEREYDQPFNHFGIPK